MKIIILDGFLIEYGGIGWDEISHCGEVTAYPDTTTAEDAAKRIGSAEAAFTNRCPLSEETFSRCPSLRFIGTFGTGYDCVDINAAKRHGITVCNIPAYGKGAVAQMALALLMEICRHTSLFDSYMKSKGWNDYADQNICDIPQRELNGKTIGILGMGDIGYAVARIAMAMDMQVLAFRRNPDPSLECEQLKFVSLDELFSQSDIISINCPLTEQTRGIICKRNIDKIKDGAIIINTSRGAIFNESDVVSALDSGKLYAVGSDVFPIEPTGKGSSLVNHPRCLATPHVAWMPSETRQRVISISAANLKAFLAGKPQNAVVNPNK